MIVKKNAFVACNGGCDNQSCSFGCISCGKCVSICRFGAIAINEKGIAEVDISKCIGCGACVRACPQRIISLHDKANHIRVRCSNTNPGSVARKECLYSCIACGLCERACPAGAIKVTSYLSGIDDSICLSCGMCLVKCPRHAIFDIRGILS